MTSKPVDPRIRELIDAVRRGSPRTKVIRAAIAAVPVLEEFLDSHMFAEAYDEIRAENEVLHKMLGGILGELRKGGIFKT